MVEQLIPTTVYHKVYDEHTLDIIKKEIHRTEKCTKNIHNYGGPNHGKLLSNLYSGDWNNPVLRRLIIAGLPKIVADNIIVHSINHLQSFIPYQLHSDYGWIDCDDSEQPLVLMLIPLETISAKTIVLDQILKGLHFTDYKKQSNQLEITQQLSENEYKKYFSHCYPQERPYISINHVFEWQVGSLLIMDLKRIHGSDNFNSSGLTEKNCITIFTKIKKSNYNSVLEFFIRP